METGLGKKVIFIMGVSGSGKTSVGQLLAKELAVPFIDADDHHPLSNIEKMSQGIPLTDSDRIPWLDQLHKIALNHLNSDLNSDLNSSCVIACSALKKKYRSRLNQSIESKTSWVYLKGTFDQIFERMKNREGHFMKAEMLQSQFETLEEPENAIVMDIADLPEIITQKIKTHLE